MIATTWPMVRLGDLLSPIWRDERVDGSREYRLLGAHLYAEGLYIKDTKLGHDIRADRLYRVEEGDFVYNRLFAWKGSFALASSDVAGCYVSNEFPCFGVNRDRLDGSFLQWYFHREAAWLQALGLSSGATPTSRNRLREVAFLNMQLPLPPLLEQRRVVKRIGELAAQIEEARGLRRQAAEEADGLRSAARRAVFISSAGDFGRVTLEDLSSRITKGESPEWQGFNYQDSGPLFIRSENVLWGSLDPSSAVHIPRAFHEKLSRSQLRKDDVLINLVGASIGRACAVPGDLGEANVNQAVGVISPNTEKLLPEFLVHFLLSPIAQTAIHGGKVETARPNISLADVRGLRIPAPPLPEQRRIVAELDALQARVDALEHLQADSASELDALLPSILDRAFHGGL